MIKAGERLPVDYSDVVRLSTTKKDRIRLCELFSKKSDKNITHDYVVQILYSDRPIPKHYVDVMKAIEKKGIENCEKWLNALRSNS